jgi:hypothetical protein
MRHTGLSWSLGWRSSGRSPGLRNQDKTGQSILQLLLYLSTSPESSLIGYVPVATASNYMLPVFPRLMHCDHPVFLLARRRKYLIERTDIYVGSAPPVLIRSSLYSKPGLEICEV